MFSRVLSDKVTQSWNISVTSAGCCYAWLETLFPSSSPESVSSCLPPVDQFFFPRMAVMARPPLPPIGQYSLLLSVGLVRFRHED